MKQKTEKGRRMTIVLLMIYLIALTWIILCKMALPGEPLPHLRSINLIPFGGSLIINGQASYDEVLQNVLAFVPLGIYIAMLFPAYPIWKKVLWGASLSLCYELLQFVFAIGATDLTDWLGNTAGVWIGVGIYRILSWCVPDHADRILRMLALLGTIGMSFLIGLLIFINS